MSKKKFEGLVDFTVHSLKYKTQLTKKFVDRKPYEAPNFNHVKSVIPGTVIEILVKVGDRVKAGESIMLLEAMKMMNQIAMPHDGKIKAIHVKQGDRIPKHQLMIELE